jgi:hypothetical protein
MKTERLKIKFTMFIIANNHQKNFSNSALFICGRSTGDIWTTFSLMNVPCRMTYYFIIALTYKGLSRDRSKGDILPDDWNMLTSVSNNRAVEMLIQEYTGIFGSSGVLVKNVARIVDKPLHEMSKEKAENPMKLQQRWSYESRLSIGSIFCLLSLFSAGCILSIGSAGSILSIGSTGSILSIGSVGSILSIGSSGSILGIGRRSAYPAKK